MWLGKGFDGSVTCRAAASVVWLSLHALHPRMKVPLFSQSHSTTQAVTACSDNPVTVTVTQFNHVSPCLFCLVVEMERSYG
jgi:hypothetical protein